MKNRLLGIMLLAGLIAASAHADHRSTSAPQAATRGHGGYYTCDHLGPGWQLVTYPQYYTYYETQYVTQYRRQCLAYGPLGFCRLWSAPTPVSVPVTVPRTVLVQANYCIFTGVVPFPGAVPSLSSH